MEKILSNSASNSSTFLLLPKSATMVSIPEMVRLSQLSGAELISPLKCSIFVHSLNLRNSLSNKVANGLVLEFPIQNHLGGGVARNIFTDYKFRVKNVNQSIERAPKENVCLFHSIQYNGKETFELRVVIRMLWIIQI